MKSSLVLVVGLLSSLVAGAAHPNEPIVNGKPVSFWVGGFSRVPGIRNAAEWTPAVRDAFSANGKCFAPFVLTYATTNKDETINYEDSQFASESAFRFLGGITRSDRHDILRAAFKDPIPHIRCNALNAATDRENGFGGPELIRLRSEFQGDKSLEVQKMVDRLLDIMMKRDVSRLQGGGNEAGAETPASSR